MYKQVLENIAGVEIYPVITLIMFFVFFLLILGWIFTLNKNYITRMENIPLDNENNTNAGGVK
ncbi:MAG: CcoQ/FixQ family Cbb3-type cytochrome c oxidase assembly chaperone [Ignavibacteria bacterium]|nr:CcoQ/FixQ family Cbb3-type cytochrome c oxidase assembly chaperone [Ignavibacteria bacterium]